MESGIIVILCIVIFMSLAMLCCTYKVKDKVTEQFKCKHCSKLNTTLKDKCEYCKARMSKGYVYKSTFFGRRNCKDEHGYFDLSITLKHIKRDAIIWISISILSVIGIICVIAFGGK